MEKLFGLEMSLIASGLGLALALVLAALALLAWRRPVMFKLGVRPILRRRAQSTLIVFGLMLATLIITAAFVTGDTLSHTIRSLAVEGMGEMDEFIQTGRGAFGGDSAADPYFKLARYEALVDQLAGYPLVDRLVPALSDSAPAVNVTRRRSLRNLSIMGLYPGDLAVLSRDEVTDARGQPLALGDLGPREVYLNAGAAKALDAAPGDALELYIGATPKVYTVRAIAAQGESPRLLMTLREAQLLFDQRGKINLIAVSNQGDALSGVRHSQAVTAHLRGLLTDAKVAAQLYAMLSADGSAAAALRAAADDEQGNVQADLRALADGLEAGALAPATRSLLADPGLADRVQTILARAGWRSQSARDRLGELYADLSDLAVDDIKRDLLDQAELAASAFTTIFIVAGLFGIAAGLVLIFLIFVMLAAERKSEMGMTRAVGAQRGHLVEMFVFEGAAYDLAAAAVGVALGVGAGVAAALTLGQAFAGAGNVTIRPYVAVRSLAVAYSLGMLVTFATVYFSAVRVSRLNIVAAIRDLPDPARPPTYLRDRLLAPLRVVLDGFRQLFRLRLARAVKAWVIGLPRAIGRLIWLGFAGGPLTLLLGAAMAPAGVQASSGTVYSVGASLIVIGAGLTLRNLLRPALRLAARGAAWAEPLADRIAYTALGLTLAVFWSLPFGFLEERLGLPEDLSSGPEMLFISGFLLVVGAVLVIMFNTDLLLNGLLSVLGGAGRIAPVLRMSIAYPLAARYRTGMTIGIFAVVMFSVVFMATVFQAEDSFFGDTDALTGNFDLRVETSRYNPVDDLKRAVASRPGLDRADYAVIAARTSLAAEVRQGEGSFESYVVNGVDDAYLENIGYDLAVKAEGYSTSAEVWQAVRDNPGYAVIDQYAVPSRQTTSIIIGGPEFQLEGVYLEDKTMKPIRLQVREPGSQATFDLTIIGVMEQEAAYLGFGLVTAQATLEAALPSADLPRTYFVRLAEGVDRQAAGAALESAFLKNGLQSVDQVDEVTRAQASQRVIYQLLLGFLTLGLVVGVAALGVISTRAVVERRQQIGMLRALGFRREMVAWSFLIESSFVALLGIGLGAVLGLIPAYHMITDLAVEIQGLRFEMPWVQLVLVSTLAYGMALFTTWLPAVQASRVSPAEALRYE